MKSNVASCSLDTVIMQLSANELALSISLSDYMSDVEFPVCGTAPQVDKK